MYSVAVGEDSVKEFQYKKDAKAFIVEEELDAEIESRTILEPLQNALHIVDSMVGGIAHHFGVSPQDLDIALTGANNFRDAVAFTQKYKGNRTKPKPVHYPDIRAYFLKKYGAKMIDNEEADDYLGYSQYAQWYFDPMSTAIVTIDKDLDMIPGIHYNPVTDEQYYVEEDEADYFFLKQLVSGDRSDHIPGIPGYAEKKAATYLHEIRSEDRLAKIRDLYVEHYGENAQRVLDEQADLLWIRRSPNQKWTNYWPEGVEDIWQKAN